MSHHNKNKDRVKYKCAICGRLSSEQEYCDDAEMVKLCECGSGRYTGQCCAA